MRQEPTRTDGLGDPDSSERAAALVKIHGPHLLTMARNYSKKHPTRSIVGVIYEADSPVTDLLRDIKPCPVGPSGSIGVLPHAIAVEILRLYTHIRPGVNWLAPAASGDLRTLPVLIAMRSWMRMRAIVYRTST